MKVYLEYFNWTGKWKYDGEFEVPREYAMFMIWDAVRELNKRGELPGLNSGQWHGPISVDVPEHPHNHPHLVMPHVCVCKGQGTTTVSRPTIPE